MSRFLPLVLAALLSPASANELLVSERVAVGVNPDGSLCDNGRRLCLMVDPDGPEGPIPLGRDLLLPGRAFEAWGASWTHDGTAHVVRAQAPDAQGPLRPTWEASRITGEFVSMRGSADLGGGLSVQIDIDVPRDGDLVFMTHTFRASAAVQGLEATRAVDSDADFFRSRSYNTRNEASGPVAVAASRFEVGTAVAVGVRDGVAAVCSWCVTPDEVRAGVAGPIEADRVIAARSQPVDLAAGEEIALRFVYAFGPDAPTARQRALDAIEVVDLDQDGVTEAGGDCDDRDASVYAGAPELPDGRDNDCDEAVDEGTSATDGDEDGFSPAQGDCDDADDRVYPGAPAVAGVVDADCDGIADQQPFDDGAPPEGWGVIDETAGVGCASVDARGAGLLALLVFPLLARRIRRRSSP